MLCQGLYTVMLSLSTLRSATFLAMSKPFISMLAVVIVVYNLIHVGAYGNKKISLNLIFYILIFVFTRFFTYSS